jgi:hypothetical protein
MKLTALERRWVEGIMEGFAPPGSGDADHLGPEQGEADYAGTFEELNGCGGPKVAYGVRAAAMLIATSPIWAKAKPALIHQLTTAERVALLEDLLGHRLQIVRELTLLMKVQASMALLREPTIRARSGYDDDRAKGTPVRLRLNREDGGTVREVA